MSNTDLGIDAHTVLINFTFYFEFKFHDRLGIVNIN